MNFFIVLLPFRYYFVLNLPLAERKGIKKRPSPVPNVLKDRHLVCGATLLGGTKPPISNQSANTLPAR